MRIPLVAAGAAAAVVLGPALTAREILARDMVALERPALTARLLGLGHETPRGVPSDAVVALLGQVLSGGLVVAWLCFLCLAVAGAGAARLVDDLGGGERRGWWWVSPVATAVATVWNPWVAERLAIGQWPLLLGYAVLPWLVARVVAGRWGPGLVGWAVVGGLGGAVSWLLLAIGWVAAAGVALARRGRGQGRAVAVAGVSLLAIAVPWAAPALLRPGATTSDPAGFAVFGPRADLPVGTWLSVLTGGGIWNGAAVPPARDSVPGAVGALAVLALAGLGLALVMGRASSDSRAASLARDQVVALAAAGATGLGLALVTAWGPVAEALAAAPGGGLLRDSTRAVAPWALALAVGLGVAAGRVVRAGLPWAAAALTLLPVAVLPGAAWGVGGALRATETPDAVRAVAVAVDADPVTGAVAVLPWAAYRRYGWNGGRPSVVPWSRLVHRRVVTSGDLVVHTPRGEVTVAGEDALATRVAAALTDPDPAAALARGGVGLVLVDGPPGTASAVLEREMSLVTDRGGIRLYRVVGAGRGVPPPVGVDPPPAPVLALDGAASALLIGVAAATRRVRRRATPEESVG